MIIRKWWKIVCCPASFKWASVCVCVASTPASTLDKWFVKGLYWKCTVFSPSLPTSVQLRVIPLRGCQVCRWYRHRYKYLLDLSIISCEFASLPFCASSTQHWWGLSFFLLSCGINPHCLKVLITSAMHGLACRYSSLPQLRKMATSDGVSHESFQSFPRNAFLPCHSVALHADQDLQRQFAFAHSKALPRSITGPCSKFTSVLFLCM